MGITKTEPHDVLVPLLRRYRCTPPSGSIRADCPPAMLHTHAAAHHLRAFPADSAPGEACGEISARRPLWRDTGSALSGTSFPTFSLPQSALAFTDRLQSVRPIPRSGVSGPD